MVHASKSHVAQQPVRTLMMLNFGNILSLAPAHWSFKSICLPKQALLTHKLINAVYRYKEELALFARQ